MRVALRAPSHPLAAPPADPPGHGILWTSGGAAARSSLGGSSPACSSLPPALRFGGDWRDCAGELSERAGRSANRRANQPAQQESLLTHVIVKGLSSCIDPAWSSARMRLESRGGPREVQGSPPPPPALFGPPLLVYPCDGQLVTLLPCAWGRLGLPATRDVFPEGD